MCCGKFILFVKDCLDGKSEIQQFQHVEIAGKTTLHGCMKIYTKKAHVLGGLFYYLLAVTSIAHRLIG